MHKNHMFFEMIPTPALLINEAVLKFNLKTMQELANRQGVSLRPHTKTHRTPEIARMQLECGSEGITVATVGEAECMFFAGISDIFIANEIADTEKLMRLKRLIALGCTLKLGVDNPYHVELAQTVFSGSDYNLSLLIEIDVGNGRAGVQDYETVRLLVERIEESENLCFCGVFSHEGHSYNAESIEACKKISQESHVKTVNIANRLMSNGIRIDTVSVGSTPSILTSPVLKGVTEIRPGTYPLMDASQAAVIDNYDSCAATILSTVISKPVEGRVVLNAGAKAITGQIVNNGITRNQGYGYIYKYDVWPSAFFDEHTVVKDERFYREVNIGDKVEIIPNHICPAVNLYDYFYLIGNSGYRKISIDCRGKSI